jgi:hypothetical protein
MAFDAAADLGALASYRDAHNLMNCDEPSRRFSAGQGPVSKYAASSDIRPRSRSGQTDCQRFDHFLRCCHSTATDGPEFRRRYRFGLECVGGIGGRRMIIDLDSWEVGYRDGHSGRPSECPVNRDQPSYSNGYVQGRADRGGRRKRGVRLRQPISTWERSRSVR